MDPNQLLLYPTITMRGVEYLDTDDAEYVLLMHACVQRMRQYQHADHINFALAPREPATSSTPGWLEFMYTIQFRDGGTLTVGAIQRKPGEPFEFHS